MKKEDLNLFILFFAGSFFALLLSIILARYNLNLLGEFSKTYAYFIVIGHFFLFSIHDNIVQNIPNLKKNKINEHLNNSFAICLLLSILSFCILILFWIFFFEFLKKLKLNEVMLTTALTTPLFIINKYFCGVINSREQMVKYFFFNSLRPFFIFVVILYIIIYSNKLFIGYSIVISEILLFLIIINDNKLNFLNSKLLRINRIKKITLFLLKSWPHSFLSYSFIRIDILTLSFFVTNEKLGIYSFFALLTEGIYQLGTVLRDKINPSLAKFLKQKVFKIGLFKVQLFTNFTITITVIICLIYLSNYFYILNEEIMSFQLTFYILLFGILIFSTFSIFENIFIMNNKPSYQSFFILLSNIINVTLNIILIPLFSLIGASVSTACTFLLMTIMIIFYCKANEH